MLKNAKGNKMPAATEFERAIERLTGETVDHLRETTIDERRREIEKKIGRSMRFISRFPFIGRGNVLRDRTLSHSRVNEIVDEALGNR